MGFPKSGPEHSGHSSQGDFEVQDNPGSGHPSPPQPVRHSHRKLSWTNMLEGDAESKLDSENGIFSQESYPTATAAPGTSGVSYEVGQAKPPAEVDSRGDDGRSGIKSRFYRPPHRILSTHMGQTHENGKSVCMEFFSPRDPKLILGIKRIETMQEEPIADISSFLTFHKNWSFNHPIYYAILHIRNKSNGSIAFKVIPSNVKKLCMTETNVQGVLERGATKAVTVVTHSMIPYKYVDIMREVVDVAFAPVELIDSVTQKRIENPCQCLWDKLGKGALDNFWTLNPPGGSGAGMGLKRIRDLRPADAAFLAEKSVMWAEWKPWKFARSVGRCIHHPMTSWGEGVADFLRCDFDTEKRFFWNCIDRMFPNQMDLDRTEWLADTNSNRKYTTISLTKKIIKLLILCLLIGFWYTVVPTIPKIWKWSIISKEMP